MITGIGVDIFSLGRLPTLTDKEGFFQQVFTVEEFRDAPKGERRDEFFARLYATKEAILKALGCGLHPAFSWHDITVIDGSRVCLSGKLRELAERQGVEHINISSSSSTEHAVAIALLETNTPEVIP